jgi:hypothetical protein
VIVNIEQGPRLGHHDALHPRWQGSLASAPTPHRLPEVSLSAGRVLEYRTRRPYQRRA